MVVTFRPVSYSFLHNMLVLFHNKKCCNFINLFLYILWDLIVMGLALSDEDFIKTVEVI